MNDFDIFNDDILEGSPRNKFYEILPQVSSSVVAKELEAIFKQNIFLQATLKEKLNASEQEALAQQEELFVYDEENYSEELNSLYIELTATLLTQDG